MHEEIMVVERISIIDNDHGGAALEIELRSNGSGQSWMCPVEAKIAYRLLLLFQVEFLERAKGLPIVVLRNESFGLIKGLKRLACYEPYEVIGFD